MRRALAVVALGLLIVLAGCTGGVVQEEALAEDATYDWNTTAAVTVNATGTQYQYVYTVENRSEIRLSTHSQITGTTPIPISAVQFRYPNGTVVGSGAIDVAERASKTVVTFPARNGTFAYTAESGPRSLRVPVVTTRSHEVILPPGMRIALPIVGGATPPGYETDVRDDRVHLTWESVETNTIAIDYYYQRDILLFGALLLGLVVIAGVGLAYYWRAIGRLAAQRERAGLERDGET
ncbi:MAG: DUF5803 family protein [Halanaeroarchaeum sp.]